MTEREVDEVLSSMRALVPSVEHECQDRTIVEVAEMLNRDPANRKPDQCLTLQIRMQAARGSIGTERACAGTRRKTMVNIASDFFSRGAVVCADFPAAVRTTRHCVSSFPTRCPAIPYKRSDLQSKVLRGELCHPILVRFALLASASDAILHRG
jgi:hypothetical protein